MDLACSQCGGTTFDADAVDHTHLLLTLQPDGDWHEEPLERYSYTYTRLRCVGCGYEEADGYAAAQNPAPPDTLPHKPAPPGQRAELIAMARTLRESGMTYRAISAQLGYSEYWIYTLLVRAGLTTLPQPRERVRAARQAQIRALRAQGLSYRAIGAQLGLSESYCWKLCPSTTKEEPA